MKTGRHTDFLHLVLPSHSEKQEVHNGVRRREQHVARILNLDVSRLKPASKN